MFSKRNLVDVKKSTSKVQDPKKDLATRVKHLRIILDNVDSAEAKGLFEANFSHIYNILYDSFIQAEANLRQRVHKAHKEELEGALWILEQVLCLLPELIHKRWQLHSLGRLLAKLLHPGNAVKMRRQAIRYFLMWYQALNYNAPDYVHAMFATIVPGFACLPPEQSLLPLLAQMGGAGVTASSANASSCVFHDTSAQHPVSATEVLPILPPSGGEKPTEQPSKFFLEALLEHMVQTVVKLEWHDRPSNHHRCFHFLLEKFKVAYLPKICPNFDHTMSLYQLNLDLPVLRKPEPESEFVACRVTLIMWVASFMHQTKKNSADATSGNTSTATGPIPGLPVNPEDESQHESNHPSLDSSLSIQSHTKGGAGGSDEELAAQIVRDVLCSSRDNVDFVHELYRQALLVNFSHVIAIRKIIALYKDLIQMNGGDQMPAYALEPPETALNSASADQQEPPPRLRNDSYLGAIHKDNLIVRAGMQNILQMFMTHAANVFLLEVNSQGNPKMLEEQTDACKRVLNIYRYMVMNTRMDNSTWEQLLVVLLQVTSLVLGESSSANSAKEQGGGPKKGSAASSNTLGGKLAPAIFQTLIVTWIKANLNVMISRELWDRLLHVLTSLANWEELIKEWAKTMETLTRVLARHVYNLDLTDLPLDRLTEQKSKRGIGGGGRRGTTNGNTATNRQTGQSAAAIGSSVLIGQQQYLGIGGCGDRISATEVCHRRQDSVSLPDGNVLMSGRAPDDDNCKQSKLSRSYSETSLATAKRRSSQRTIIANKDTLTKHRRSFSLDTLHRLAAGVMANNSNVATLDGESSDRTRSPSPAPSSGMENTSIKDSPIQLDVVTATTLAEHAAIGPLFANDQQGQQPMAGEEHRGVVCGGYVRGWLPDVAVILWRRMLGALGDVNAISSPKLHAQVFEYLVKLTDTLIRIQQNQGVSPDNQSTPAAPELVPPLTLVLPWCFGALMLPDTHEAGKIHAVRLLCTITLNCGQHHRAHLPHFYRFLHTALTGESKSALNTTLKYLGPRFLSLQLDGWSLLLLDLIHACNIVLNSATSPESLEGSPRTEAISIVANLLSLPDIGGAISVLQPKPQIHVMACPDIKEHVVTILLRAGRREPKGKARCIALSAIGTFVYKELTNRTFHPKVNDCVNVLLLSLKFNNKVIVQLASNILFLLCDHAALLWSHYPRLGNSIVRTLCSALLLHTPLDDSGGGGGGDCKALSTALLLCLGEWCMRLGPKRLLERAEYGGGADKRNTSSCLLLQVFNVLFKVATERGPTPRGGGDPAAAETDSTGSGSVKSGGSGSGGNIASEETPSNSGGAESDFDPNILSDDLSCGGGGAMSSPSRNRQCRRAVALCARTLLSHLVSHLGHFPMAIGAARLSSLVMEHDDVPQFTSSASAAATATLSSSANSCGNNNNIELSAGIFSAPDIQLFVLTSSVVASLIELPALQLPGGGVTAGLATAQKQVRVLLRDLSGKASWDASILYRTPPPKDRDSSSASSSSSSSSSCAIDRPQRRPRRRRRHWQQQEEEEENLSGGRRRRSESDEENVAIEDGGEGVATLPPQPQQPESFVRPAHHHHHHHVVPLHSFPQRAMRQRPPGVLPVAADAAPDLDQLHDLLQYLGHTSPECLESLDRKPNEPVACAPSAISDSVEREAIASVINQKNTEVEESGALQHTTLMASEKMHRPSSTRSHFGRHDNENSSSYSSSIQEGAQSGGGGAGDCSTFQQCRLFFSQMGLAGWERRKQLHLLNKTERLLRELRNLDGQRCRETHKVAVIYVAPGQEDKNSILSNRGGSVAYERFLAALAWEVELEGHTGFLGGLQRQGSTGSTAPYFATSLAEVIFHVATRMTTSSGGGDDDDTPETVLNKTRHLGNDEVHIVWSEHNRDYRRDIIPTEFCDILITIYPLGNNLNRVTVKCKPEVPHFGILFHEAILESNILAGLVRATVICASRAKRTTLPFYQQYYEERAMSLDTVITKHKNTTTFEEFISKVYSPTAGSGGGIIGGGGGGGGSSNLAAALIDPHHHHQSGHNRSVAQQQQQHHHHFISGGGGSGKFQRGLMDGRGVWFGGSPPFEGGTMMTNSSPFDQPQPLSTGSSSSGSVSISPRPPKKISSSATGLATNNKGSSDNSPPQNPNATTPRKK